MSDTPLGGPVLVTGANGFVGAHVCRRLMRDGFGVRGMVRRADAILPAGVEPLIVKGLDDGAGLARAVAGVHGVIHLAARVHMMRESSADPLSEFRRANVDGTAALLSAADAAGAERFVYASSVKVNGEGKATPYTESDPPSPSDPYGVSKLEAERLVGAFPGRIRRTIVRPPLVYGPGVGGNFIRLLALSKTATRVPLPLGAIPNRRSIVFVENLADAIVHLLRREGKNGEVFLVSDGEDISTTFLMRRIARAGGWKARLIPVPAAVLRFGAMLAGCGDEADRVLGSLTVDVSKLRATGWTPPYTVDEGIQRTVAWWTGDVE